ncbi:hypothetical protein Barb6_02223 [Bacteroidales bacterium Barb6]|nr:hypothetical protein Barb6_02212 [Bacteroidales bacterium Barb6]OAV67920.1 hypothetical protein Barb6_02223 [Bacteroidales bacterium Barb6]
MFKSIRNYFKNRRDRKLRERLVLKLGHIGNNLDEYYNFILTGSCGDEKSADNRIRLRH